MIYSNNNITKLYIGNTEISKVFAGNIQVFPDTVPPIEDNIIKVGFSGEPTKSEMIYVSPTNKYIMGANNFETPNTYYTSKIYLVDSTLSSVSELTSTAHQYGASIINDRLYVYANGSTDYDYVYKYDDDTNSLKKITSSTSYWLNNIIDVDGDVYAVAKNIYKLDNDTLNVIYNPSTELRFYWGVKIGNDIIFNAATGMYKYNGTSTTKILNFGSMYKPYFINDKYYYPYGSGTINAMYIIDSNLNDNIKTFTDFTINNNGNNKLPIQIINNQLYCIGKNKNDNKNYLYRLNEDDTYTNLIEIELDSYIEMYYFNNGLYVLSRDNVVGKLYKYDIDTLQHKVLIDGTQPYYINSLSLSTDNKKLFIECNDGWRYIGI